MRVLRWLAAGIGALLIAALLHYGLDAALYPWAYPLFRGATLTGVWMGTFTSPDGLNHRVFLDLVHENKSGDDNTSAITGEVQVCPRADSEPSRGNIGGNANWSGTHLNLNLYATFSKYGTLINVPCDWKGDSLVCTFDFSRRYNDRVEAVARKAGIVTRHPPVRAEFGRHPAMPKFCTPE